MTAKVGLQGAVILLATAGCVMGAAPKAATAPMPAAAATVEPGRAILTRSCQGCHDLGTIAEAQHTAAEWPVVVAKMRANGAVLNDAEAKELQAYLIKAYPKRP